MANINALKIEEDNYGGLLNEATTLRRATAIRVYVHAVKQATIGDGIGGTTEEIERAVGSCRSRSDRSGQERSVSKVDYFRSF
ncbi:hypothetical protein ACRQ5Q_21680 [Bradyrhizobium sp. PMVTL-01]|uniref:hypothetical protein n=1 Tax=Bradyrhizobium sp. PMVTL-01 TaxID=3434999 RepID=UPI003F7235FA